MRAEHKNTMPLWGPYSKKYMGLSRIMKESKVPGARFDLVVYPTYANSSVPVPNVTVPSGYHPWECDAEGNYFRYRYELLWKDQLYTDVDFYKIDEETWGIRVSYENHTAKTQNCLLNFFTAIEYPQKQICLADVPDTSDCWNALDYEEFSFAKKRPWEHLNYDACRQGEIAVPEFTEGNGLGETMYHMASPHLSLKWFGGDPGDTVVWHRQLAHPYENAVLTIRYRTPMPDGDVSFSTAYGPLVFPAAKNPQTVRVMLGTLNSRDFSFRMTADGSSANGIELDCLCITEMSDSDIGFHQEKRNVIPQMNDENGQMEYRYHYGEPPVYFVILNKRIRSRRLDSGCLEDALITRLTNSDETYDHLTRSFSGSFSEKHSDEGFYHNSVVEAIFLPEHSSHAEYAFVSTKNRQYTQRELEAFWKQRADEARQTDLNPEGDAYRFPAQLLKTVLFSNVVYPIFRHGEPIAHYTPGKRWDSFYTWDSGFIGLGMLEYSESKAEYIMDVYLSEKENTDFAFLSHGSLIPTQFYLYYEILQRASKEKRQDLKKYYAMFRRCYRFMAGKTEGSTTSRLPGELLTVYDYFYNASGMDDYPPQAALHREHLENEISPVCSNVHLIRFAKIMKQIASLYGFADDEKEYETDYNRVADGLLDAAWDGESGYFGYVLHLKNPDRREIFRTPEGENYNKGIDGVTPLIAGVCTEEQETRILGHLKSPKELWSPIGLSTVDMSASYYYDNGYWNGSVWFPYQYLIWKSLLDIGENGFAFAVADRALSVWKQEADFSYHTFEMFQIETGRGGWFHQFGGLSSPIVIWYHAYYRQKSISAGFETWIERFRFLEDVSFAEITYRLCTKKKNVLIVVMNSKYDYEVFINGARAQWEEHVKGALEIHLREEQGEIRIKRKS